MQQVEVQSNMNVLQFRRKQLITSTNCHRVLNLHQYHFRIFKKGAKQIA